MSGGATKKSLISMLPANTVVTSDVFCRQLDWDEAALGKQDKPSFLTIIGVHALRRRLEKIHSLHFDIDILTF